MGFKKLYGKIKELYDEGFSDERPSEWEKTVSESNFNWERTQEDIDQLYAAARREDYYTVRAAVRSLYETETRFVAEGNEIPEVFQDSLKEAYELAADELSENRDYEDSNKPEELLKAEIMAYEPEEPENLSKIRQ